MADINLDRDFWQEIYELGELGWDIGYPSTPLKEYIDQLSDKSIEVLIPGAGNAWEAEHLFNSGFSNTNVVDNSRVAGHKDLKTTHGCIHVADDRLHQTVVNLPKLGTLRKW